MPDKRIELDTKLRGLFDTTPNVYYQPPSSVMLKYPCIIYNLDTYKTLHASNSLYFHMKQYQLIFITQEPDSLIPEKILKLPHCRHHRSFVKDNLYHFMFDIFY